MTAGRRSLRAACLAAAVAVAAAGVASGAAARLFVTLADPPVLPGFDTVRAAWCPSDARLADRDGEVLEETRIDSSVRRLAWTPLDAVAPPLVAAVLASEDRRFESHGGVDLGAVAAAVRQQVAGNGRRGASTISMQVAALLDAGLARARRTPAGKLRQMAAALELERRWSKREILEAYLNLAPFRGEVQGVAAAAGTIFGKLPHGLGAEESVALAASLRAPNAPAKDLERRANALAAAMAAGALDVGAGSLVAARAFANGPARNASERALIARAVAQATSAPALRGPIPSLAPHLAASLAPTAAPCRDIATTLDARVQRAAAQSLRRRLAELDDRSARDGAVLVVDNATGEVLAYVGSSGDLSAAPAVDGIRARRQAGSTLKPFLYAMAIDRGLVTAATLLEDTPLEVAVDGRLYRPANYDNRHLGLVSVRTALASSRNVPAVRTLLLSGGAELLRVLRALGFEGLDHDAGWYGPSLALGSADVTLWELVRAYATLAGGGTSREISASRGGAGPADGAAARRPVLSAEAAYVVADILSDRASRSPAFQLENVLATRFWSAVKTGTSKDMRDNWCVGFSRRYTVGVWVGNFTGEPMHDVSGTTGAAPVWRDVMDLLHEDEPSTAPPAPAGVVRAWTSFARASESARYELYVRGSEPVAAAPPALAAHARIAAPVDGSVFAIDPDLPASRQSIALVAHGASSGERWVLDGADVAPADAPHLWPPVRGRHRLELIDANRRAIESVRFEVKGERAAMR